MALVEKEVKELKSNIDGWVKDIDARMSSIENIEKIINENVNNTNHNYELILTLKNELNELKEEIKLMKVMQLVLLERKIK
ncbi:hypothetical protein D6745_02335 [Candidatus Woesearchaeota archaeon]|nr:MAG: hypothetical protein D6745_02335 [Candidatus Woesearchaeota archaeon]